MELADKLYAKMLLGKIRSGEYLPSTIVETSFGSKTVREINALDGSTKENVPYKEMIKTARDPKKSLNYSKKY